MARVTSKRQVTIPKAVADRYQIAPGDEIDWLPAGEAIRVVRRTGIQRESGIQQRLHVFDRSTLRQAARQPQVPGQPLADRGWSREELYERGVGR